MITVICMLWRDAELARRTGVYHGPADVRRLRDAVARHLATPHRFVCVTDQPEFLADLETAPIDGSLVGGAKRFPLLQLFRRDAGELLGGERLLYLDLDAVIVGPLDRLIARDEPLVLLGNRWFGTRPRFAPFRHEFILLRAGCAPHIYDGFVPHKPMRTPWSSDAADWISVNVNQTVPAITAADGVLDGRELPRRWNATGPTSYLPEGARVVILPRPAELAPLAFGRQHPWLETLDRTERALA